MSYIYLKVPQSFGQQLISLANINHNDILEYEENYHLSLAYLGKSTSTDDLLKIIPVVMDFCKDQKQFFIETDCITFFPKGEYGYPIIAKISEQERTPLASFRQKLVEALDDNNIFYDKTYPVFNPHVTLAYSSVTPQTIKIEPCFEISECVTIFSGAYKQKGVEVNIQLKGMFDK